MNKLNERQMEPCDSKLVFNVHFLPFFIVCRPEEVKNHGFFKDIDWQQVFLRRLPPPLVPPRGEVNAADAFDIGNFDEDDVKGIKVKMIEEKTN